MLIHREDTVGKKQLNEKTILARGSGVSPWMSLAQDGMPF